MAGLTIIVDIGMVVGAGAKGTRRVTKTTVLGRRRHVILRLTARREAVTGCAIVYDIGVIDNGANECIGGMAIATIFVGQRV